MRARKPAFRFELRDDKLFENFNDEEPPKRLPSKSCGSPQRFRRTGNAGCLCDGISNQPGRYDISCQNGWFGQDELSRSITEDCAKCEAGIAVSSGAV
jgi:hypothetical protein